MKHVMRFVMFFLAGMFWIFAAMVADTWPLNLDMEHGTWVLLAWFLGALMMLVGVNLDDTDHG